MLTTKAILHKINRTRGLITWHFVQNDTTGDCKAIRNDGRVFDYSDIYDMREGYRFMRDSYGFLPM